MRLSAGGLEVGEGDVGVGEAGGVYRAGGADQGLDVVVDVPHVDVHAGDHDAAGEPERDELQRVPVAPVEYLVIRARGGQARALHAEVVLVAVEVRHRVVAHGLAQHGPGGGRTAVQGVGPVLDADTPAEQRVEGVRDVAGGEDVRVRRAQRLIGQHA